VKLLEWRGDPTSPDRASPDATVDLCDAQGALETVTFDLPLGPHRLHLLEILDDDEQRFMITLHHNNTEPFFQWRSRAPFGTAHELKKKLDRRARLPAAVERFRAVAVVWLPRVLGIPLSIELPREGDPLREHLVTKSNGLMDPNPIRTAGRLNASFSYDYAARILRHGWHRHSLDKLVEILQEDAPRLARFPADESFIKRYLECQFHPTPIEKAFPFGFKPFGRQLHVYPITVSDGAYYLLNIITDWEQDRINDETQRRQYRDLRGHIEKSVEDCHGKLIKIDGAATHVKYQTGLSKESVSPLDWNGMMETANSSGFQVVIFQDDKGQTAKFYSNPDASETSESQRTQLTQRSESTEESDRLTLTQHELDVLVEFLEAPDGVSIESIFPRKYQKHLNNMRHKLEPGLNRRESKDRDKSRYWKETSAKHQEAKLSFKARYLVVVHEATSIETSKEGRHAGARGRSGSR
jgi:hypothetical protein